MLRLLGLLTLIALVWLAILAERRGTYRPYLDQGIQFVREWARAEKSRTEGKEEADEVKKQALSSRGPQHTRGDESPHSERAFEKLTGQGIVTDRFLERGPSPADEKRAVPAAVTRAAEQSDLETKSTPEPQRFSQAYEEAKTRLFEAMAILEGRRDGDP